ncbi:alpha/beta hydrolase family protein [Labrys okinawensis]|uniref:alpha/beta hydrolase family protein n=1 Tax=Labrys okinawensis TaxID=346911 RepID=UPI0039BD0546
MIARGKAWHLSPTLGRFVQGQIALPSRCFFSQEEVEMRLVFIVVAVLILILPARAANVGFEEIEISNGNDRPLAGGIWYPTEAPATEHRVGSFKQIVAQGASILGQRLPLVVFSHGGGGSFESNYDTAWALAHNGFVVAAISHAGDTYDDQSQVLHLWRRPAQLHRLISYMLEEWPGRDRLDGNHIGAFGFSNGGFTVLVAAGGVPDLDKMKPYCQAHPDHDLCQSLRQAGIDLRLGTNVPGDAWIPDKRIKALVVAAPAFGFTFSPAGLAAVHVPIQLWRAANDSHQPAPYYDEAVRLALPRPPEYHVVANAGHYDFLPPCGPHLAKMAPLICMDPASFDREAFHTEFNSEVVRFFAANLQ